MQIVQGPPPDAVVRVIVTEAAKEFGVPKRATPGAAGFDLVAVEDVTLDPFVPKLVKTGIKVAVPEGFELQVRPRSGMSLKEQVIVANSPGTVDSDYRGEICVIMTYLPTYDQARYQSNKGAVKEIKRGTRVAQAVVVRLPTVAMCEVQELDDTQRGEGGFGSTGASA